MSEAIELRVVDAEVPPEPIQADRTKFLGASDAAGVLGLSRWKTPMQVWAEKTGLVESEDISNKLPVKLGLRMEPIVAELFTEATGKPVRRADVRRQVHPKYPFISCETDFELVDEDAILQVKTASGWKKKEWDGEEIPQEYIIQEHHELAVTGKKRAYIAVLIGNEEFVWKVIERDEKVIADMIRREVAFWNDFVIPQIMPEVIKAADSDILFQLFRDPRPATVAALPAEMDAIIDYIQALKKDKDALEGLIDQNENELKAKIGNAEAGETATMFVTWKKQITNRVDTTRLKTENIALYNQYLKPSEYRVLRFKKK